MRRSKPRRRGSGCRCATGRIGAASIPAPRWDNQAADLANFDAQAKTTEDSYSTQLLAAYGQGYASSKTYAQQMIDLEASLASQRLAIMSNYAQQAKAQKASAESSASGVISGLTNYATSLALGSTSPLNAQNQYALAQTQFNAELTKAQTGDPTALGLLQSDSSAFLTASQNLNGSGAQYAADFAAVVTALGNLANTSQTQLTQQFMQAALQSQTDQLTTAIAGLQTTVAAVKAELVQANARP